MRQIERFRRRFNGVQYKGIAGMTTGSEFGAVVNSLLPCAAGVGAMSGSSKKKPEDKYDFKDVVKKAFAEMKEYKDDQAA